MCNERTPDNDARHRESGIGLDCDVITRNRNLKEIIRSFSSAIPSSKVVGREKPSEQYQMVAPFGNVLLEL